MSYSPVPLINGLIIDTQEYLTSQKITVTKEEKNLLKRTLELSLIHI